MSELDHAKVLAAAKLLEPDSQTSLPIAIRKLGRYHFASNRLVRAARKFSYYKNIEIETVIPSPHPQTEPTDPSLTASSCLTNILRPQPQLFILDSTQTVARALSGCRLSKSDTHFQPILLAKQPVSR